MIPVASFISRRSGSGFCSSVLGPHGFRIRAKRPRVIVPAGSSHSLPSTCTVTLRPFGTVTLKLRFTSMTLLSVTDFNPDVRPFSSHQAPFTRMVSAHDGGVGSGCSGFGSACLMRIDLIVTFSVAGFRAAFAHETNNDFAYRTTWLVFFMVTVTLSPRAPTCTFWLPLLEPCFTVR